jgi:pimeloyl-ACP methyl ester carboxylesterase
MRGAEPDGGAVAAGGGDGGEDVETPLTTLGSLAAVEVMVTPSLRHIEVYTTEGLLSLFWHGPSDATDVVIACGGAMGGVLGPAEGIFHELGEWLATEHGIGTIRVGYRVPNDLVRCVHDLAAAADLATRSGAARFITIGHSFGGAPALNAGIAFGQHCAGVIGLATQSAGCERGDQLGDTPLLLLHGTEDRILPIQASQTVQMIVGDGELVALPGTGHLLTEARDEVRDRLREWIPARFADHAARGREE